MARVLRGTLNEQTVEIPTTDAHGSRPVATPGATRADSRRHRQGHGFDGSLTCNDGETCSAAAAFRTPVSHMLTEQRAARRLELDACGHRRREFIRGRLSGLLLQTLPQ